MMGVSVRKPQELGRGEGELHRVLLQVSTGTRSGSGWLPELLWRSRNRQPSKLDSTKNQTLMGLVLGAGGI